MFCRKGVRRNFAKFIRKHLCQSLFLNKVGGPRPATLLKKRLRHRCFPVNFVKFLRTPFFIEHFWWLLLNFLCEKVNVSLIHATHIYYSWILKNIINSLWRKLLPYRNQSINWLRKSMDWFVYDNGLRHKRVKFLGFASYQ